MPVLVPIALLTNYWWKEIRFRKRILAIGLLFPALAFVLYFAALITNKSSYYSNSDKFLIENHFDSTLPIYHWQNKSYSSQFYTKGQVKVVADSNGLINRIDENQPFLIIIPHKKIKEIDPSTMSLLKELDANYKKGIYQYKEKPDH